MTIHVNIAEAKARLSELISAAVRGEDVVIARAGVPQVSLTAKKAASDAEWEKIRTRRKAAYGMWKDELKDWDGVIPDSEADPDPAIGY